ncbi:BTB/POZ domain-containing protein 9 [Halotydeus destructor]|nr:BTB/POZ domain-containing protein 9 [Halotydeus destructor]
MKKIDHASDLLKTFASYFNSEHLSDVTLVICDKKFFGHKFVLAARSDYFHALLFGGLKESNQETIELKETPLKACVALLKYIYTGHLDIGELKDRDAIIDLFMLAHRFGFDKLLSSMCSDAGQLLTLDNVIVYYEASLFYQLNDLSNKCLEFLDEHAVAFLKHYSLPRTPPSTLATILCRNTFCAAEVLIFIGIERYFLENTSCSEEEIRDILNSVRLPLIDNEKLIVKVKESGLFTWPEVSAAIASMEDKSLTASLTRYGMTPDENVFMKGIHVVSPPNLDRATEVARHQLRDGSAGILIEFHKPYLINKIRWKVSATLVDPIQSPFPAYDAFVVDVSLDGSNWTRVLEREQVGSNCLLFWSERTFFFKPQVVQYIHIRGENRRIQLEREMTYWFQVKSFEAMYTSELFDFTSEGILMPKFNCSAIPLSESTAKDDYFRAICDLELKYQHVRTHRIRGKYIEFTLDQLCEVNYVKLLLWDDDPKVAYSFVIEMSSDDKTWDTVVDQRYNECKAWQEFKFAARKVFLIRIRGTAVYNCDFGNLFKICHFECCSK